MIEVIERCFKDRMKDSGWQSRMKEMVPSYGESLVDNAELLKAVRRRTLTTLELGF